MWHSNAPCLQGYWPYTEEVICPAPPPSDLPSVYDDFDLASRDILETASGKQLLNLCISGIPFQILADVWQETDLLPADPPAHRYGWRIAIYRQPGFVVKKGGEVVDPQGRRWLLEERLSGDDWQEVWTMVRKA